MKNYVKCLLCAGLFGLGTLRSFANEREFMLIEFQRENKLAEMTLQNAMTTVDIVAAAGNSRRIAEKQFFRALDYKLRHAASPAERLELLRRSFQLGREVQKISDTPREDRGSLIGMQIYFKIANLLQHQTSVLMLDKTSEIRWKALSGAPFILNGKEIDLSSGMARAAEKAGDAVVLQIMLHPQDTFTYQNRHFAIVTANIPFAMNNDFAAVYLCELKNGKLVVHTKCRFPSFSKWEIRNNEFIFYKQEQLQKIVL